MTIEGLAMATTIGVDGSDGAGAAGKPDAGLLQLPPYNRFVRLKISHINGYVCRVG